MTAVRAKKALGQHFLTDLNIARKICDALSGGAIRLHPAAPGTGVPDAAFSETAAPGPAASEHAVPCAGADVPAADTAAEACDVLEVGCGMGVLTQFLLRRTDLVTWGAEIDAESVAYLHAHYPEFAPRLIEGDFLKMDLRARFPRGLRIIGIFFRVLEYRDLVPECVGMVQREVAVRIAEGPGSKEYGILSVLLQAWYDIEYLFTVSETVFSPPPKVKSAVIRLRRNATRRLACDEALFVRVVKAAFGQRRKMIRNALRAAFGDFGGAEHPFFTRRAEQLSVADFVALTNWVAEHRA